MRTAAAAILVSAALTAPAAATTNEPAGSWRGSWTNAATGAAGSARLLPGPALRLAGPALGCAEPTVLPLRYRRGRLTGAGRAVPCNEGLRHWSFQGRLAHGRIPAKLTLRLADGYRVAVVVRLRRVG